MRLVVLTLGVLLTVPMLLPTLVQTLNSWSLPIVSLRFLFGTNKVSLVGERMLDYLVCDSDRQDLIRELQHSATLPVARLNSAD